MIIERRALLRGLFAAPAIVAASSLMPLRGIAMQSADEMMMWRETMDAALDAISRQIGMASARLLDMGRCNLVLTPRQHVLLHECRLPPIAHGDTVNVSYMVSLE